MRRQRVRRLRQGRARAQQLERARLPQHLRGHRGLLRAQRAERRRRPLRLAPAARGPASTSARGTSSWATCWWRASPSASRCCGSSSRRPCARSSPGRRRRRSTATSTCAREAGGPLLVWSPLAGESCQVEVGSLDELRKLQPGVEARGRSPSATTRARSSAAPSCGGYELARLLPGLPAADDLPADVRRLLGWSGKEPLAPGAFPARRCRSRPCPRASAVARPARPGCGG